MRSGILWALILVGCGQPRNETITEPAVTVATTSASDARAPDAAAPDAAPPHDGGTVVADAHTSVPHPLDARVAIDAAPPPTPDARPPIDAPFPRADAGHARDAGLLRDAPIMPRTGAAYDPP